VLAHAVVQLSLQHSLALKVTLAVEHQSLCCKLLMTSVEHIHGLWPNHVASMATSQFFGFRPSTSLEPVVWKTEMLRSAFTTSSICLMLSKRLQTRRLCWSKSGRMSFPTILMCEGGGGHKFCSLVLCLSTAPSQDDASCSCPLHSPHHAQQHSLQALGGLLAPCGSVHHLVGCSPSLWVLDVPRHARLACKGLWRSLV